GRPPRGRRVARLWSPFRCPAAGAEGTDPDAGTERAAKRRASPAATPELDGPASCRRRGRRLRRDRARDLGLDAFDVKRPARVRVVTTGREAGGGWQWRWCRGGPERRRGPCARATPRPCRENV